MKKWLLFSLIIGCSAAFGQSRPAVISFKDLQTIINSSKPRTVPKAVDTFFFKKTGNFFVIEAEHETEAKGLKKLPLIQVYQKGNKPNTTGAADFKIDNEDGTAAIALDIFKSAPDGSEFILYTTKNKMEFPIYSFTKGTAQEDVDAAKQNASKASIKDMIECTKLRFGLDNITFTRDCCCGDSGNPCDAPDKKCGDKPAVIPYNSNRIIFHADPPRLSYYNHKGTLKEINGTYRFRNITVRGGMPLTFEIRNVNPSAFDVSITDSLHREVVTPGGLFEALMVKLPETLAGSIKGFSSGTGGKKELKCDQKDSVKVALYLIAESLDGFLKRMQAACLNQHYSIIDAKLKAKDTIDGFIKSTFGLQPAIGFREFTAQHLDPKDKGDSALMVILKTMYSLLPSAPYRFQATTVVPTNVNKVEYRFNILAREGTSYLNLVRNGSVDAYVVGNWRPEVSAGLYYAGFDEDRYILRKDSVVGRNAANTMDSVLRRGSRLIDADNKKGEFGFNSFLHYSYRATAWLSISGLIGAGVSFTETPRPRFFFGGGFVLGKESRVGISGGAVFGPVNRLFPNRYERDANNEFKWLPVEATEVDYQKQLQARGFISLTYKLPIGNKTTTVSAPADNANTSSANAGSSQKSSDADDKDKYEGKKAKTETAKPTSSGSNLKVRKSVERFGKN
jgi:hypothetical protein